MLTYILHVSLLLGLGFILYQLLLKKETFYSLNRFILASYLVLAFSLPLIHIPDTWSLKNTEVIASIQDNPLKEKTHEAIDSKIDELSAKDTEGNKNATISALNNKKYPSNESSALSIEELKKSNNTSPETQKLATKPTWNIDWMSALKWMYFVGLGIFLINFLVQFSILIYYRIKYPTLQDGKMTIVEMEGNKAPFSFLNMIYINPTKYDYDTYEQILAHEKIHITKWHSADIFLSELALILQWFNPFAWYYRKAVEHNLEYLTDQEMLASGANAEVYQMNLLKVSVPDLPLALSTNYNQSFLKKRIQMMNAKKSSARSTWKYLFILPILGFTMAAMNPTFSTAQNTQPLESSEAEASSESSKETQEQKETKATKSKLTPKEKVQVKQELTIKTANGVTVKTQEVMPNIALIDPKKPLDDIFINHDISILNLDPNEDMHVITDDDVIKITTASGKSMTINNESGRSIVRNSKEDLEHKGIWEAEIKGNEVCFYIKKGGIGKSYFWSSTECMKTTDFTPPVKRDLEGEFMLKRDAGKLTLKGEFQGNDGTGRYTFEPNEDFNKFLVSQGFKIEEKKLIHFFLADVNRAYFNFLKSNGYGDIDEDELLAMAIHDVDEEYIKDVNGEFRKVNYKQATAEELISMKIHDVDMEYIKSFGKELKEDLTVDQIISAAIHDVDPTYISTFKSLGYEDMTFDNLISAAIHDVDPEYIKEFKDAGFNDLKFDQMISAAIHDVDPEYIKEFKDAGFNDLKFDQMISAAIHDVDPAYIKAFESAGLKNVKFDDLISASIHDVDVDFIKDFEGAGFDDLNFDDLISAAIHDVDVDYIKQARSYGFELSFDQLISASIHDVDLDLLKAFNNAGMKNLSFDDMITASIHDIEPSYIEEFQGLGFKDLDFDDLTAAAIHDIEPSFIKEIKNAGMSNISFDNIISFGIHNIDVDDIVGLSEMGFKLDADEMISAGIHGVTPHFIKKMQAKGYKDLDFDEYVRLKIHGF